MSNNNQRSRTGSDIPESLAAANPGLNDLTREQVAHGEARAPRVPMNTGDFNLSFPAHLMREDKKYYWFFDDGKGRLEQAKAAWWDHVTNESGVNYSAMSGASRFYLMMIDKIYYNEDEELRMKNYRDSITSRDDESLNVEGVEAYTPSGEKNKLKVTSDPFAS